MFKFKTLIAIAAIFGVIATITSFGRRVKARR